MGNFVNIFQMVDEVVIVALSPLKLVIIVIIVKTSISFVGIIFFRRLFDWCRYILLSHLMYVCHLLIAHIEDWC